MASTYEIGPYSKPFPLAADIISVFLLSCSVLTAGVIILAISRLHNKNKLRSRMILGLFVSHLWAGGLFLGFITASLAGHHPHTGSASCYIAAYAVEAALWTEYIWTIVLAGVTYRILIHPTSVLTEILERYWLYVGLAVYTLALALAGLQSGLYQATYIGGFCWSGSDENVFNKLVGCLPRAIVFVIILSVYVKIHLFFRRRNRNSHVMSALMTAGKLHIKPTHQELAVRPPSPTGPAPWEKMALPGGANLDTLPTSETQRSIPEIQDAAPKASHPNESDASGSESPIGVLHTLDELDVFSNPKMNGESGSMEGSESQSSSSAAVLRAMDRWSLGANTPSPSVHSLDSSVYYGDVRSTPAPMLKRRTTNPYDAGAVYIAPGQVLDEHQGERIRAREENMESLHSLLTRKAALLFLLFPLTYAILTIISLARLIDDYAAPHPNQVMRAISRWTLFLQGPLDALTYGLAAWKIKKDVWKDIQAGWSRHPATDGDSEAIKEDKREQTS